jgi:type II secretory pathway pseudopilin PulG
VRRRGAFTIVELLLALMLASLVLASMVAVLRVMMMADAVSAQRVDQQTDLAIAQHLMRRVFVSLGAAQPLDPATARRLADEAARDAQTSGDEADEEDALTPEDALPKDQAALAPMAPPDIAPMFDLYFAELADGTAAPVLECVVNDPPGTLNPSAQRLTLADFRGVARGSTRAGALLSRRIVQTVRGRFEVVPFEETEAGGVRFALVWRGVEPASDPVVLIRGIVGLEWWVLPIDNTQRDWRPTMSAKLASEFPISVRLVAWLDDGRELDWMFETEMQVLTPEAKQFIPGQTPPPGGDADDEDGAP